MSWFPHFSRHPRTDFGISKIVTVILSKYEIKSISDRTNFCLFFHHVFIELPVVVGNQGYELGGLVIER